jgi:hypothetical protein
VRDEHELEDLLARIRRAHELYVRAKTHRDRRLCILEHQDAMADLVRWHGAESYLKPGLDLSYAVAALDDTRWSIRY